MKNKLWMALPLSAGLILIAQSRVLAVDLMGDLTLYFHNYEGFVTSFDIVTPTGQVASTGYSTSTLNLASNPSGNTAVFDFDNNTINAHLDGLITNPLLQSLGLPPQKFSNNFETSIVIQNEEVNPGLNTLMIGGTLTGTGELQGEFLPGSKVTYSPKPYEITLVAEVNEQGNVVSVQPSQSNNFSTSGPSFTTAPDGSQIPLVSGFEGRLNPEPVPESSSALGTLAFGVLGVGHMLKRKLKMQR